MTTPTPHGATVHIIEPPDFDPRPGVTDGMSPDDLWQYACLVGYRYKLSEHDREQSTRAAIQQADQERVATMQEAMRQGTAHFYATCKTGLNGQDGALMRALELVYKYGRGSSAVEPRESGSVVGSIPTSGHPIQQAAVPEGLADLLLSCRGSVKADLMRYEQMILSCNRGSKPVFEAEANRLRALLDSIDALAASPAPTKQQPDHLAGGECGGVQVPLTDEQAALVWPIAQDKWNACADGYNQWDGLGRDEMSILIVREAELQLGIAPRPDEATGQIKIRTYCEDCGKSVSDEPDGIHTCSPQYGKEASQINPAPTDQTGYHDPARIAAWNAANPDSAAGQGKDADHG